MQPRANHKLRDPVAACRMRDTIALHQSVLGFDELLAGRFVAIRLSDGGSDNTVYDTREDAIRGQRHDAARHGYFQLPLERWSEHTCDTLLWYVRTAYDNGHREDPAHQLYIPNQIEHILRPT